MVYADFMQGLRIVYAVFTQSLRKCLRKVYAEFTQSLSTVYADNAQFTQSLRRFTQFVYILSPA